MRDEKLSDHRYRADEIGDAQRVDNRLPLSLAQTVAPLS